MAWFLTITKEQREMNSVIWCGKPLSELQRRLSNSILYKYLLWQHSQTGAQDKNTTIRIIIIITAFIAVIIIIDKQKIILSVEI